jgi:hypothetical protein
MSDDDIAEIRARHEQVPSGNLSIAAISLAHADRATLLVEVERLRADVERLTGLSKQLAEGLGDEIRRFDDELLKNDRLDAENDRLLAEIERLRAALRECACACSSIRECVSEWARDGKCPHADARNALEGKP